MISKTKYYSKIDMKSAYHQIQMHPDSIEYRAFICQFGSFEYLRIPMGISSTPAWFQRFIDRILQDFITAITLRSYFDDILVYTEDLDEHCEVAKRVINLLAERNLKACDKKSEMLTTEVEFLGNIISNGQIRPHPKRAECISNISKPQTIADLQRLMGIANYSRQYITNYAELVRPLYALMNLKDVPNNARKKSNGAVIDKKCHSFGLPKPKISRTAQRRHV